MSNTDNDTPKPRKKYYTRKVNIMNYIYYVVAAQPGGPFSGSGFYSLEVSTNQKITSSQDVVNLLPLVRKTLRDDLIERGKKEGFNNMVKAIPENSHEQVQVISFNLLREE
jgi:hypothetical protein